MTNPSLLPVTAEAVAALLKREYSQSKELSIVALVLCEGGDPGPLASLLRDRSKPVPPMIRDYLADVLTGKKVLKLAHGNESIDEASRLMLRRAAGWYLAAKQRGESGTATFKRLVLQHIAADCGASEVRVRDYWKAVAMPMAKAFHVKPRERAEEEADFLSDPFGRVKKGVQKRWNPPPF